MDTYPLDRETLRTLDLATLRTLANVLRARWRVAQRDGHVDRARGLADAIMETMDVWRSASYVVTGLDPLQVEGE